MTVIAPPIVCPVCGSHGQRLHRDIRASLVYTCMACQHEWQIDPTAEPEEDPAKVERLPLASTRRAPRRPA